MKYIAMTSGVIPVAARVTDEKAEEMTQGAWRYVTKAKYKAIRKQTEEIKAGRRYAEQKARDEQASEQSRQRLGVVTPIASALRAAMGKTRH